MKPEGFDRGDPLAELLIDKWKLDPRHLALITWTVPIVIFSVFALVSDTWKSTPSQIGLSQDFNIWYSSILNSITYGYYLWISNGAIFDLFRRLEEAGVVRITEEDFHLISKVYRKPWRRLLSFIISFFGNIQLFLLASTVDRTSSGGWINSNSALLLRLTHVVISFIGSYMIWMLVFGFLLNIWLIQKVLKDKVLKLNPLHPDRCSGMAALSDYSLKTAYLSILYAVMIGLFTYQQIIQNSNYKGFLAYLAIPIYILVSLFCFLAPLMTAHAKMKAVKNEALKVVALQFQDDYAQAQSNLNENAESIKKRTEKMQELKSFYKLTDEFPVWPFDTRNIRQYLLTMTAPLIPPVVAVFQKIGTELLKNFGISL